MTPQMLIAEGEALRKRCFRLTRTGSGPAAAYWGGERSDIPSSFPPEVTRFVRRRHIVSIDEALLQSIGVPHPLGLYEWFDVDEDSHYHVERDRTKAFASLQFSGDPLYAIEASSFPPFEALCLHGSSRIAEWLATLGWARHEYWRVPRALTSEYAAHYAAELLRLETNTDVIVGGWHRMWPEDDYYTPPELIHVLLTLRDAEPWYSVWYASLSRGCFARAHVS